MKNKILLVLLLAIGFNCYSQTPVYKTTTSALNGVNSILRSGTDSYSIKDTLANYQKLTDGIVTGLVPTASGNNLSITAGTYRLNNIILSASARTFSAIPLSASGLQRILVIFGNTSGGLDTLSGAQSTNPVTPILPANTIRLGFTTVTSTVLNPPSQDLSGKSNLTGGNSFTGNQSISGGNLSVNNGTAYVYGTSTFRGTTTHQSGAIFNGFYGGSSANEGVNMIYGNSSNAPVALRVGNSANYALIFGANTTVGSYINSVSSTSNTPANMFIAPNSGKVLLGTTTDNGVDKLQVSGTASVSGLALSTSPTTVTGTQYVAVRDSTSGIIKQIKTSSISAGGVSSITGTANQVISSTATGAVTLSLPQSIATTSTPTFAQITSPSFIKSYSTFGTSGSPIYEPLITYGTGTVKSIISGGNTGNSDFGTDLLFQVNSTVGASTLINALSIISSGGAASVNSLVPLTGTSATLTGKLNLSIPTSTNVPLNMPYGVAPTTPITGDIWSLSTGVRTQTYDGTNTKDVLFDKTNSVLAGLGNVSLLANNAGTIGTAPTVTYLTSGTLIKSSAYTITSTDFGSNGFVNVFVSGNTTITLPTASVMSGVQIRVIKTDGAGTTITLSTGGTVTIQNHSIIVVSDGTNRIELL